MSQEVAGQGEGRGRGGGGGGGGKEGVSGLKRSRKLLGLEESHDENVNCVNPCAHFQPPHPTLQQFPTQKCVIRRMRFHLTLGGKHNMSTANAVKDVAKAVYNLLPLI